MPILLILWKFKYWIAIAVLSFICFGQLAHTNHLRGKLQEAESKCTAKIQEIEQNIMMLKSENHNSGAINVIRGRGKDQGTYVVEDLVYSYAMWISAKFHLMVIRAYRSQVMEWMIGGKQTISPEQCGILYNIVHTRAGDNKNTIVQMWSRLKNHFKYSASYRELRAIHFEDAKHYLEVMDLKVKTEKKESKPEAFNLNEHNIQGLAIHMIWVYKWWKEFGPAIRALSPRMAGDIHDNFIDGHSFATHFIDKPTRLAIDEKTKDYQWHASFKEKMGLDFSK